MVPKYGRIGLLFTFNMYGRLREIDLFIVIVCNDAAEAEEDGWDPAVRKAL